ncbi:hypothetical protein FA95DRAFT_1606126 [Auriscalpium vulgare]|uniref:Uncharacterized protein n=1 Tax=Auriscalpium vulgare TaxID=40419 RepID=A0ACB8RUY7_9AGAM|nr:hypothetical protein FA95DRAFT_1606126 [Auriscalpium vulgare]
MASPVLAGFNRGGTIGVEYLGVVFSSILYGVSCLQTFQYSRSVKARSDVWWIKAMVLILFTLDTIHEAFLIHIPYHYLITHYDEPESLLKDIWSIPFSVIIHSLIAFITNSFFVYRIWKLSVNKLVSAFCSASVVAAVAGALVYTVRFSLVQDIVKAEITLKSMGIVAISLTAAASVVISATMAYYLHANRTGFRHSDDVITKLTVLVVSTGSVTTFFSIVELISYVVAPDLLYVLMFEFIIGKLHVNSVLTCLNMRDLIRNLGDSNGISSIHLSRIRHESSAAAPKHERQQVVDLSPLVQSNVVDNSVKFHVSYISNASDA